MTDKSNRYNKPNEKRGSLNNIAVKLYGTSWPNSHPKDENNPVLPETMFHPWFLGKNSVAFKVMAYTAIGPGVNADDKGDRTLNSVDLAILTVDTDAFFKTINVDMDKQLKRLEWVTNEKHRIKGRLT